MPGIDTDQAFITEDGQCLRFVLGDGTARTAEAAALWTHCPSALRRRQKLDGRVPQAPAGLRIVRVTAIGNYAVNIAFSDGHDRGVYPWSLLDEIARKPRLSDFLIPAGDAGIALHAAN